MPRVVVANKYVDRSGRVHKGGDEVTVTRGEARDLIAAGKVRPVAKPADKQVAKPADKGATNG